MPRITTLIARESERIETLDHRMLRLIVSQRIKLARRADLAALDPLAGQNVRLSDHNDSGATKLLLAPELYQRLGTKQIPVDFTRSLPA